MCLSVELSEDELIEFINLYNEKFGKSNFDILVHGRLENMIIKGNILNIEFGYSNYSLIDFKDREFPVYYDGVNTHILNYETKNIRRINNCILRYDFYNEDSSKIKKIVN